MGKCCEIFTKVKKWLITGLQADFLPKTSLVLQKFKKMFKYSPIIKEYKSLIGAIDVEEKLLIRVISDAKWVNILIAKDGDGYNCYSMTKDESKGGFFVQLENLTQGLYFYHFESNEGLFGAGNDLWAVKGTYNYYRDYQLTVTCKDYQTTDILKGGLIYQIFPDRFKRGGTATIGQGKVLCKNWGATPTYRNHEGLVLNNEFFGGDFKGILQKLYYLKGLGVTVVYLNPIVKAYSSHRYDTGDYLQVDPLLGTEEDLKTLLMAANKMGIDFIFDGVYNHTGADSKYFNKTGSYDEVGAYNSKESKYYDWYDFYNYPDGYNSWWGFENLPTIKKNSESFQNFICEKVLPHYFEMGFKGVRLDVVDELTDDFVVKIRKVAKKYKAVVIGEVWEDATNKYSYGVRRKYFLGQELDSVMNYQLKDAICDFLINKRTDYLVYVLTTQVNNYPKCALDSLMNLLSSHDTVRIINMLGRKQVITDKDKLKDVTLFDEELQRGKTLAKIAYAIAFTVYGSPSIYYGDEVGLTGDLDPYNRRCFPWGKEDKEYLKFFKTLGKIRTTESLFATGSFSIMYYDKQIIVYERNDGENRIVVAANVSSTEVKLHFTKPLINLMENKDKQYTFILNPESFLILKQC